MPHGRTSFPSRARQQALVFVNCENVLAGEMYEIGGGYAGYAQAEFESAHSGAIGLFMLLCGGDRNPNPRGKLEYARKHGKSLAAAVSRVVEGEMQPVTGPIKTAYTVTDLAFAPHTRELFEQERTSKVAVNVLRTRLMLKAYDERRPVRRTPYPLHQIRVKKEFANTPNLVTAGYSNDVMCFIRSVRSLREATRGHRWRSETKLERLAVKSATLVGSGLRSAEPGARIPPRRSLSLRRRSGRVVPPTTFRGVQREVLQRSDSKTLPASVFLTFAPLPKCK